MRKIHLYTIILFLTASCETTFDPDIADEPRIVVNAFFGQAFPASVQLYQTNFITKNPELIPVNNAEVIITDVITQEQYILDGSSGGHYHSDFTNFRIGTAYELQVNAPGLPSVSGSDVIPGAVRVSSFTVENELTTVNIDEQGFKATVSFEDDAFTENYYVIETILASPGSADIFSGTPGLIFIEDPNINAGGNNDIQVGDVSLIDAEPSLFFNDLQFNGERAILNFFLAPRNSGDQENRDIYVVVKSVSRNYYDFLRTTRSQQDIMDEDAFVEPVQIHGNIENGHGIFAGFGFDILQAQRIN